MKLYIGDEVLVTMGKDKGRRGKIDKVFPKEGSVSVGGVNIYKKFRKAYMGQAGGVSEVIRPLKLASIALICPKCDQQTRVGYEIDKAGNKARICRKCKTIIEKQKNKK